MNKDIPDLSTLRVVAQRLGSGAYASADRKRHTTSRSPSPLASSASSQPPVAANTSGNIGHPARCATRPLKNLSSDELNGVSSTCVPRPSHAAAGRVLFDASSVASGVRSPTGHAGQHSITAASSQPNYADAASISPPHFSPLQTQQSVLAAGSVTESVPVAAVVAPSLISPSCDCLTHDSAASRAAVAVAGSKTIRRPSPHDTQFNTPRADSTTSVSKEQKTVCLRIASTISPAGPLSQSPNPWDMIEVLSHPDQPTDYVIVERPDNRSEMACDDSDDLRRSGEGEDDDGDQASISTVSSFCLTEVLEDMRELDKMEGADVVRPLEELRTILVRAEMPIKDRIDHSQILKNLQLRDNWLMFIAKHFRRLLIRVAKQQEAADTRLNFVCEIFSQLVSNSQQAAFSPGRELERKPAQEFFAPSPTAPDRRRVRADLQVAAAGAQMSSLGDSRGFCEPARVICPTQESPRGFADREDTNRSFLQSNRESPTALNMPSGEGRGTGLTASKYPKADGEDLAMGLEDTQTAHPCHSAPPGRRHDEPLGSMSIIAVHGSYSGHGAVSGSAAGTDAGGRGRGALLSWGREESSPGTSIVQTEWSTPTRTPSEDDKDRAHGPSTIRSASSTSSSTHNYGSRVCPVVAALPDLSGLAGAAPFCISVVTSRLPRTAVGHDGFVFFSQSIERRAMAQRNRNQAMAKAHRSTFA